MQPEYTLVIMNERFHRLHIFRIIFLWINVILLCWFAYTLQNMFAGIFALLAALYALYDLFFSKKNIYHGTIEKVLLHGILFAIMGWLSLQFFLLALFLAAWAFMGLKIKEHFWLKLDSSGLSLHTFYIKEYAWSDLQNIILRDGMLTLDLKTNKIFQATVIEQIPGDGEESFNIFCRAQMENIQNETGGKKL